MASKTFLLLALAFAVVLLITSEVVSASNSEVDSGTGGALDPGHTGYGRCKHGCCSSGPYKTCKCCPTFEEATAYKQTQN